MNVRALFTLAVLNATIAVSGATSLEVVLPANTTTGAPFSFTVSARNGSAIDASYIGTVDFASSDAGATLPADYAFTSSDAGAHTFSATMATAGPFDATRNQTITATDVSSAAINGGTGVTTVHWAPDVVRRIVIDVPENVDRAVSFQGTVFAWNADGQVVPSYRGTVHFRGTAGVVLPPDYTFTAGDSGAHTFTFTADRGGNHVITSEDLLEPSTGSSDSFHVDCPELTASAANQGPVCPNGTDSTILIGNSNQTDVTYYWSGPHTWFSFEQNPSAPIPGTYFLEVTNALGCAAHAQTTVGAKELRSPTMAVAPRVCGGDTVTASVTDASDFSNFDWALDGQGTIVSGQGTSAIQIATPILDGHSSLDIRVAATYTPSGCRSIASTPVDIDRRPISNIATALSACPNATLTASVPAHPATSYLWSITNGTITQSMGPSIEYRANSSGDVVITARLVSELSSCESTDIAVVALDGPTATLEATNLAACASTPVEISVQLSGTPPFTLMWSDGISQSGINSTTTTRSVAPAEPKTYSIVNISDAMCSRPVTGGVTVNVETEPIILSEPRNLAISRGETATLSVDATGHNLTFFWYQGTTGDHSHLLSSGPSALFTTPPLTETTRYWVEAESACGATRSRTAVVSVSNKRRSARH